jgi:hypothetical protein
MLYTEVVLSIFFSITFLSFLWIVHGIFFFFVLSRVERREQDVHVKEGVFLISLHPNTGTMELGGWEAVVLLGLPGYFLYASERPLWRRLARGKRRKKKKKKKGAWNNCRDIKIV